MKVLDGLLLQTLAELKVGVGKGLENDAEIKVTLGHLEKRLAGEAMDRGKLADRLDAVEKLAKDSLSLHDSAPHAVLGRHWRLAMVLALSLTVGVAWGWQAGLRTLMSGAGLPAPPASPTSVAGGS